MVKLSQQGDVGVDVPIAQSEKAKTWQHYNALFLGTNVANNFVSICQRHREQAPPLPSV